MRLTDIIIDGVNIMLDGERLKVSRLGITSMDRPAKNVLGGFGPRRRLAVELQSLYGGKLKEWFRVVSFLHGWVIT